MLPSWGFSGRAKTISRKEGGGGDFTAAGSIDTAVVMLQLGNRALTSYKLID